MRILVKIGGAALAEDQRRATFARAVLHAVDAGHEIIVVHGGGPQIGAWSDRLGLEIERRDGLRVTDDHTIEVVLAVLGGTINRTLTRDLVSAGVSACGLTGADGGLFTATQHRPGGHDLGFVGRVQSVRPALIESLLTGKTVPVIAPVAPGDTPTTAANFYNINADMAAAALAVELGADALLLLTDVDGVRDGQRELPVLTATACAQLRARGALAGGMLPKVDAALWTLQHAPQALVKIANGAGPDAILEALAARHGTTFLAPTSDPTADAPLTASIDP